MSKRIAMGLTLSLAIIVPSAAAHSNLRATQTGVQLDGAIANPSPGTNNAFFSGSVASSKKSCRSNRDLRVFRKKQGKDLPVGRGRSATTNARPAPFDVVGKVETSGKYYVKASTTNACRSDKSNTITVKAK